MHLRNYANFGYAEMAGVNMRLEAGAIRELHWHKTSEVITLHSPSIRVICKKINFHYSGPTLLRERCK